MIKMAESVLKAGFPVFVDATFRAQEDRELIETTAIRNRVTFLGLWCEVPLELAIQRISNRSHDASDADVEVRRQQDRGDLGVLKWLRVDTSGSIDQIAPGVIAQVKDHMSDDIVGRGR
jgi:predicted kinase